MAIEDAAVLARHLARTPAPQALRDFERERWGRTTAITRGSWRLGRIGQVQSRIACALRNSVAAKNEQSGVRITASFNGGITGGAGGPTINLGPDSLGQNVLQTPTNGNKGAGICIDGNFMNAAQSLSAKANFFSGKDCSAAATMPLLMVNSSLDGCANGLDVGIERTPNNLQQTNVRVLLANCQDL